MRKLLSLALAAALCLSLAVPAFAASTAQTAAADRLHSLGLFNGTGANADGTPNYDLDRAPSRAEAVTMLVRLLGKEQEAQMGTWTIPFTDVPSWAVPYVGYAYEHKYTNGTSATTFGGDSLVNATQYLTLALRALGYTSGEDFAWDSAWTLTDQLGITSGQYSADSAFTRGDVVLTSSAALDAPVKGSSQTLLEVIQTEVVSPAPSPTPDPQPEPQPAPQPEPDYSQSGNIPPDTIPGDDYVLNLHTMKFHYPSCRDVAKIADENRHDYTGTRETLLKYGYDSCGHCNP